MPKGLSLSVSLPVALAVSIALGSQRIFSPLSLAVCALGCTLGVGCARGTPSRLASPGSWALPVPGRAAVPPDAGSPSAPAVHAAAAAPSVVPSPSQEVAASLLRSCVAQGCLSSDSHSLPFSCAAAQTCSTCTASQFQRCLWPAWIGRSRRVGTGYGLGHQELPTGPASPAAPFTRLSRSSRCLSWVAAFRRRLWTLCALYSGLRGPSCHGVFVQLR